MRRLGLAPLLAAALVGCGTPGTVPAPVTPTLVAVYGPSNAAAPTAAVNRSYPVLPAAKSVRIDVDTVSDNQLFSVRLDGGMELEESTNATNQRRMELRDAGIPHFAVSKHEGQNRWRIVVALPPQDGSPDRAHLIHIATRGPAGSPPSAPLAVGVRNVSGKVRSTLKGRIYVYSEQKGSRPKSTDLEMQLNFDHSQMEVTVGSLSVAPMGYVDGDGDPQQVEFLLDGSDPATFDPATGRLELDLSVTIEDSGGPDTDLDLKFVTSDAGAFGGQSSNVGEPLDMIHGTVRMNAIATPGYGLPRQKMHATGVVMPLP